MTNYPDLPEVLAVIEAAWARGERRHSETTTPARLMDWQTLQAIEAVIPLTAHRVSYGKFVHRVLVTASGLPVALDHYSGRGRKRGGLVIANPNPDICYKPESIDGAGAMYLEDCWPTGGSKYIAASRAVLAEFWAGGHLVEVMERLGQRSGCCCICGAALSVPESIARGIGPECIKKPWVAWYYAELMRRGLLAS